MQSVNPVQHRLCPCTHHILIAQCCRLTTPAHDEHPDGTQPEPMSAVASRAGAIGACLAACKAAESDAELVAPALRALTAALQSHEARDEFREAAGMGCLKKLATRHAGTHVPM